MELIYKNKTIRTVGLFGLGKSNLGVYEYLSQKYPFLSFVLRSDRAVETSLPFKKKYFNEKATYDIQEDILFLSPTVRRERCEIADAAQRGVILTSDVEYFIDSVKSDVFAVTGSDGKSTTSLLASKLLLGKYKKPVPCANFGLATLPLLGSDCDAFVCELSSFQLNYFRPKTKSAVITNISKNHLDWHISYEEYISAKENILFGAERTAYCFDSKDTRELFEGRRASTVFSMERSYYELKALARADDYITLDNGAITLSGEMILNASDIRLHGRHNVYNYMAAIALTLPYFDKYALSELAKDFAGLSHRRETFGCFEGVTYINSSIDSSPKRTVATLESFSRPVILVLGGRSKGLDYSELATAIKKGASKVILTGENRLEILDALKSFGDDYYNGITFYVIEDFENAVETCMKIARNGDTVLLSPASTSFDKFKSFEERGETFKRIILKKYKKL